MATEASRPARTAREGRRRRARTPRPRPRGPRAAAARRRAGAPRAAPPGGRGRRAARAPRAATAAASTSTASSAPDDPLRSGPSASAPSPAEVHTVNYKELAAVVSDTPIEVFDATRENVLAHERVNETVMRNHTVIPMSFGTVFKTRDDIVELLRAAYDAFKDVLNKMEDKLEFGLKVLWDRDVDDPRDRERGRGRAAAQGRDLLPEGLDLLRAHAVRPAGGRRPGGALRALRARHLRAAAARCRWPPAPTSRSATR